VSVDVSYANQIELADVEKENSEDESIFNGDGEQEKHREYIKNLEISNSPESVMETRVKVKMVSISADSESSEERSGT
jgi:hypothetical protein